MADQTPNPYRSARAKAQHSNRRKAIEKRPAELRRYLRYGSVNKEVRPFLLAAETMYAELHDYLGGERAGKLRLAMLSDFVHQGVVQQILQQLFFDTLDPNLAPKITACASARTRIAQALGLDGLQDDALDLNAYIEQRKGVAKGSTAGDSTEDVEVLDD